MIRIEVLPALQLQKKPAKNPGVFVRLVRNGSRELEVYAKSKDAAVRELVSFWREHRKHRKDRHV